MERTALAGMRRCLRSGRGLRCTTQSPTASTYIAIHICPARSMANSSSGISMAANLALKPTPRSSLTTKSSLHTSSIRSGGYGFEPAAQDIAEPKKGKLVAPEYQHAEEKEIFDLLNEGLEPTKLWVKDVSGGCGEMYDIEIESERFRGLSVLKQQRLVNETIGIPKIKSWHGCQLKTFVP